MIRGNSLSGKSGDIAAYATKDDYFSEGGQVVGQWQGEGAAQAGLVGDVKQEDFRQILDGKTPDGQQLGTVREGELEHRPGWDFTISAPKSVSEIALVAGDPRVIAAHEAGVKAAIAVLEQGAQYRERVNGEVVHFRGYGIVATTFNHSTSRAGDPQLHTHVIVANMVRAADGTWRSLETREMFELQRAADMAYKAELAAHLERAGYQLDIDRKTGNFEVRGVPESLRELHSQRIEQINQALQALGISRETASAEQRDKASLDTRADKVHEDPAAARERWQADAKEHGWNYETHKREAIERAASRDQRPETAARTADHAVAFATEHLSERESRFTRVELETVAMGRAMGDATPNEIRAAVDRAVVDGTLVQREIDHGSNHPATAAFTTPQAIRGETRMLASEARGRGKLDGVLSKPEALAVVARAEVRAAAQGHAWNQGQRDAAIGALTSRNTVTGIQGYAGTAKTSTVLATLAEAARDRGIEVKAMAPTGTAAQKLGHEIGAESSTVTKFLNDAAKPGNENIGRGGVWVVDEASLLSTGQARALVELAEGRGAHLILTGDIKQHEAVEAGGPFAQLQNVGMKTYALEDILRQQNPELRDAVYLAAVGKGVEAFDKLVAGGGRVVEIADADARHQQIAKDYTSLNHTERDNIMLVSSPRNGRDAITANVREYLVQKGELSGPVVNVQGLDRVDMTKAQARYADNYQVGQVVQFAHNLKGAGLEAGKLYEVVGTNKETNRVTLKAEDGSLREWNPKQGGAGHVSVVERVNVELRQGDKVALTGKLENGTNGMSGRVEAVNGREAMVRLQNGEAVRVRDGETLPLTHGFVQTTYKAEGQTSREVWMNMPGSGKGARASTDRANYAGMSRAQVKATIYTDSKEKLAARVSKPTAKTNALNRGAETMAAQHGRGDDHLASRGPSIAEANQRITAGLDKPPTALQRVDAKRGPAPSQVAERMGANKAPSEAEHLRQATGMAATEKSQPQHVKAPSIDEVRQRIEKPIERDSAGHSGRDRASDHERAGGVTTAELERAAPEINYEREMSWSERLYEDNALDSVQADKWNAERAAEISGSERDAGAQSNEDRQSTTDREAPTERDGGEHTRQEPVDEYHHDDAGVDREVESAKFERDAGPESGHAAAWSELDRDHDQLASHTERGTEANQERSEADHSKVEHQPTAEREPAGERGREGDGQQREETGNEVGRTSDLAGPERETAAMANEDRQTVIDRGMPAERDGGEHTRQEPVDEYHHDDAGVDREVENARFEHDVGPESSYAAAYTELGRDGDQLIDRTAPGAEAIQERSEPAQERQGSGSEQHVDRDAGGVQRSEQPERSSSSEQYHAERSPALDRDVDRARESGAQTKQPEGAEKTEQLVDARQSISDREASASSTAREAGNGRRAENSGTRDQAGRESVTELSRTQHVRDGGQERGIAPSKVAERLLSTMVERAQTRAVESGNQVTRDVGRDQAREDLGSGKSGEQEHKHHDGLER